MHRDTHRGMTIADDFTTTQNVRDIELLPDWLGHQILSDCRPIGI